MSINTIRIFQVLLKVGSEKFLVAEEALCYPPHTRVLQVTQQILANNGDGIAAIVRALHLFHWTDLEVLWKLCARIQFYSCIRSVVASSEDAVVRAAQEREKTFRLCVAPEGDNRARPWARDD